MYDMNITKIAPHNNSSYFHYVSTNEILFTCSTRRMSAPVQQVVAKESGDIYCISYEFI